MLWSCRYWVEIWKETERQINVRFRTNLEIKYHNVIMGFNPENCKNRAAIKTIIMAFNCQVIIAEQDCRTKNLKKSIKSELFTMK